MRYAKALAVAIATLMLATAGFALVSSDDDSLDATTPTGGIASYNFYIGVTGDSVFTNYTGSGYNAYIALVNALTSASVSVTADSAYTTTSDGYLTINSLYGTVTSLFGHTNGENVWNVYMYNNQGSWVAGPVNALGFYQAYSDYDSSLRTANIILWYGASGTNVNNLGITLPSSGLKDFVWIENNDVYQVTFHISYDTNMSRPSEISPAAWSYMTSHTGTYNGYGSNAYLALCNAISSVDGIDEMYNITYSGINNSAYGRVTSIMDVDQYNTLDAAAGEGYTTYTSTYYYWSLYTGDLSSSSSYASFNLGFYSPISGLGSSYVFDEFSLKFCASAYSWQEQDA